MALRRAFFQISVLIGCIAFGLTLWQTLDQDKFDLLTAALRSVGVGVAIMICALVVFRIIAIFDHSSK